MDVSDPAAPREVGFYVTPGHADGVAIVGNHVFIAAQLGGLRVVDVSNPTAPREVGFYDTPGYANRVALAGGYAYVADGEGGLLILHSELFQPYQLFLPLVMRSQP